MKLIQVRDKELALLIKAVEKYHNDLTVQLIQEDDDFIKDDLQDEINDAMLLQDRLEEVEED